MSECESCNRYAQFLDEVRQMRLAQKKYFATRDTAVLQDSKALERAVDRSIERLRHGAQRELF